MHPGHRAARRRQHVRRRHCALPFEERGCAAWCVLRDITPLKEVERMKDEFVSNVSHELRADHQPKLHHYLLGVNPDIYSDYMDNLARGSSPVTSSRMLMLSRMDQTASAWSLRRLTSIRCCGQYVSEQALIAEDRAGAGAQADGGPAARPGRPGHAAGVEHPADQRFNAAARRRVEVRSLLSRRAVAGWASA